MKKKANSKSVFVLETVNATTNRYPKRKAERINSAFFSTLEKAEEGLQKFISEERDYEERRPRKEWDFEHVGYIIYERPMDKSMFFEFNQISARSYSLDGKLLDEFLTPDDPPVHMFYGYDGSKIHFHKGDIVEVAYGTYTELSIVYKVPPTPEDCEAQIERLKKKYTDNWEFFGEMDYSDDCYMVFSLGEGDTHADPLCYNVFPPSRPVSKKLERELREKLKEMEAKYDGKSGV